METDLKYILATGVFIIIVVLLVMYFCKPLYNNTLINKNTVYYEKIVSSKYGTDTIYIKKSKIDSLDFIKHIKD